MTSVFLSYGRVDGSAGAARLRTELEQAGISVWQDIRDMQGGKEWRGQLRQAIMKVEAVLVLLTPASAVSKYVELEWQLAPTLEIKVIPLLILPCDVPEELKPIHYHNLSTPDKYTLGLMALIRDLNSLSSSEQAKAASAPPAPGSQVFNINGPMTNSIAGNYGTQTNTNTHINPSASEMATTIVFVQQSFAQFAQDIRQLDAASQAKLTPLIQQAKVEAVQIENGNASPDHETRLERLLNTLQVMGGDIGEVFITTLASPPDGIKLVIQKIARKIKENGSTPVG